MTPSPVTPLWTGAPPGPPCPGWGSEPPQHPRAPSQRTEEQDSQEHNQEQGWSSEESGWEWQSQPQAHPPTIVPSMGQGNS